MSKKFFGFVTASVLLLSGNAFAQNVSTDTVRGNKCVSLCTKENCRREVKCINPKGVCDGKFECFGHHENGRPGKFQGKRHRNYFKNLNLTEEQQEKVRELREEKRAEMKKLNEKFDKKIENVLTAAQKKQLSDMKNANKDAKKDMKKCTRKDRCKDGRERRNRR